jgi:hypothetical protein
MKNFMLIAVAAVVILGGAAYYYWQRLQSMPSPVSLSVPAPTTPSAPLAPPPPPMHQVVEAPPAPTPLPQLGESDSFTVDALAGLIGDKSSMKLFRTEHVIHKIVATIDNLPRQRVALSVMPVVPVPDGFIPAQSNTALTISPANAPRYAPYVKIAEAIDAKKLVALYIRLYPLFQRSYEELGYPKKYFNDRVIEALDDLLAAPDMKEPVQLVQPHVFYLYADPDLEARSAGQKILMRIGSDNEAKVKEKLKKIKQELTLHMHEVKAGADQ